MDPFYQYLIKEMDGLDLIQTNAVKAYVLDSDATIELKKTRRLLELSRLES